MMIMGNIDTILVETVGLFSFALGLFACGVSYADTRFNPPKGNYTLYIVKLFSVAGESYCTDKEFRYVFDPENSKEP